MHTQSTIERFWSKVIVLADDECWEWGAAINSSGYGVIKVSGKVVLAHRVSYEIFVGDIPDGLWVLHMCDNRPCVNPTHLFLGTVQDNVADMMQKGRCRSGAHQRDGVKITRNDVSEIRVRARSGESHLSISRDFPISRPMVSMIVSGQKWSSVV